MNSINFFNTFIDEAAFDLVHESLKSTFVSSGRANDIFESQLQNFIGNPHIFTVNSGTSALHLALILAGVKPGDEVILPSQTFIASGLAVLYLNAIPVFVDIDLDGNINPNSAERAITERTKAILAVHWSGKAVDLESLSAIAKTHKIKLIEDAAHAFGGVYHEKKIGNHSDFTCFSFQAIKHLTTGDGGAICCGNEADFEEGKRLRWFGIDREKDTPNHLGERSYNLRKIGFKYHLNDMAANLGIANLKNFETRIALRRELAQIYQVNLNSIKGLDLIDYDYINDAFWLYGILVERRDEFISAMKNANIPVSVVHQGIHKNEIFHDFPKQELSNQKFFDEHQIHLPIHDNLSKEQVYFICETIKKGW